MKIFFLSFMTFVFFISFNFFVVGIINRISLSFFFLFYPVVAINLNKNILISLLHMTKKTIRTFHFRQAQNAQPDYCSEFI